MLSHLNSISDSPLLIRRFDLRNLDLFNTHCPYSDSLARQALRHLEEQRSAAIHNQHFFASDLDHCIVDLNLAAMSVDG